MSQGHRVIYVDECSFTMSGNRFTTYAPRGQGVVLNRYQSVTERVYAISGITPQGKLHYAVQKRAYNSEQVIDFLNHLLDQLTGQLHLVWDNASIHVSKAIKTFLDQERPKKRLTLYALPKYCPELNPDEQVWNHLKNHDLIRQEFSKKTKLVQAIEHQFEKLQQIPSLIRSFFKHPDVAFL